RACVVPEGAGAGPWYPQRPPRDSGKQQSLASRARGGVSTFHERDTRLHERKTLISTNLQPRVHRYWPSNVEVVWRSFQNVEMDCLELFGSTIAFQSYRVLDRIVAGLDVLVDSKKTA